MFQNSFFPFPFFGRKKITKWKVCWFNTTHGSFLYSLDLLPDAVDIVHTARFWCNSLQIKRVFMTWAATLFLHYVFCFFCCFWIPIATKYVWMHTQMMCPASCSTWNGSCGNGDVAKDSFVSKRERRIKNCLTMIISYFFFFFFISFTDNTQHLSTSNYYLQVSLEPFEIRIQLVASNIRAYTRANDAHLCEMLHFAIFLVFIWKSDCVRHVYNTLVTVIASRLNCAENRINSFKTLVFFCYCIWIVSSVMYVKSWNHMKKRSYYLSIIIA